MCRSHEGKYVILQYCLKNHIKERKKLLYQYQSSLSLSLNNQKLFLSTPSLSTITTNPPLLPPPPPPPPPPPCFLSLPLSTVCLPHNRI
ncbi:hypothetical protein Hanom_Chr17g01549741 [Helianthus anomalus]